MKNDLRAEDIAEDLLYITGQALFGRATQAVEACFDIPQMLETQSGKRLIESAEDIRKVFEDVRAYFSRNGITDIVRTVVSAEFLAPTMIGATHVSQLMLPDGTPFRAPYPTYSILRLNCGKWRIASSIYAIIDCPEHASALSGTERMIEGGQLNPNEGNEERPRP